MKTNIETNVIESVGIIGNVKRLIITFVIIISPFIVYYAFILGLYAADNLNHLGETGQHLPINIPSPPLYPWYYMSLSAGMLLGLVWIAIGIKYLKR